MPTAIAPHRSISVPLGAAVLMLVVYASLYPFEGWRWPPGTTLFELLRLPRPRWHTAFDDGANLLGYVPLGALVFVAVVRSGGRAWGAAVAGALSAALVSFLLEVAQQFIPGRVPSLRDWLLNSAGGAIGVTMAAFALWLGWFGAWQRVRERWLLPRSAGAVVLLLLWPLGLLFPAPVALGLGQVFGELHQLTAAAFDNTPWADNVADLWPEPAADEAPLGRAAEALATALGLLAPCLLAMVVIRRGWRRLVAVAGALVLALAAMTLSTALNFGPLHALAWRTPVTLPALALGTLLAMLLCLAGVRLVAALALFFLGIMVALVAQAPADPYFAASLQAWEQGRFIRFHGLAQWIGWLWPYAAMAWLVARLVRRD